jgi:hypothetical protein
MAMSILSPEAALSPEGVLAIAGLVRIDHASEFYLANKIDILNGLLYLLLEEGSNPSAGAL